jgi:hypothetical protein
MDQQSDRTQLERNLEQCRRLSVGTSDSTTSARLAKLIDDLNIVYVRTNNLPTDRRAVLS